MHNNIVTIVGGTGFIGRYVVKRLADAGYRIRVLSRHPDAALSLKTAGNVGQIDLEYGNLTKPESLDGKLEGSYAVINLVGILYERGAQKFDDVQAKGAELLAQKAKAAGASRFVQISALGVDKTSGSEYAHSKLLGEKSVFAAFPEATILRPSVVFGAEDNFLNQFAGMAQFSPLLPLIGGGKTKFQPVYVDDVAAAIQTAIADDNTKGQIYELGGPKTYSFKELLEFITRTIHKKRALVSLPFGVASAIGFFNEFLPSPMITRDQVRLLKYDNVISPQAKGFKELGITPYAVEDIAPKLLKRFAPYQKVA